MVAIIPKKPLRVLVRRYPLILYYDDEYMYYSSPYTFRPKLVSGCLRFLMPRTIDAIVEKKILEKFPELSGIEYVVNFRPPVELELSIEETLKVIEELIRLPVKLRISGFEELGLGDLARQHNRRVKKHAAYSL